MKYVEKFSEIFSKMYILAVTAIAFMCVLILSCINSGITCYLSIKEESYFTRDSIVINLMSVLLLLLLLVFANKNDYVAGFIKRVNEDEAFFNKCRKVMLGIIFAMTIIWVLASQYSPGADQLYIQDAVYEFEWNNFTSFADGGYISEYPNQIGMAVMSWLFSIIFGEHNYIAIQIANAIGIVVIYKVFSDILKILEFGRIEQLAMPAVGVIFLPLILYSSFVYGTIPGLMFTMVSIKYEMLFFREYKKKDIIFSAAAICLAIIFKSNYLIAFIGIFIYAVIEILSQKKWRESWALIALVVAFAIQSTVPTMFLEKTTGYKLDHGSSAWAWIAMGFQEGSLGPGWYNGYTASTYRMANYDPKEQEKIAKQELQKIKEKFSQDRDYAVNFMMKKVASEWAEPSYQCFWISQVRYSRIKNSDWAWWLISVPGSYIVIKFLNLFQIIILIGTLLYLIYCRNRANYRQSLIFIMIFIGGFIFHLFWEAKGQYTLPYFILLFPYAIAGCGRASQKLGDVIDGVIKKKKRKKEKDESITGIVLYIVALVVMVFAATMSFEGRVSYLTEATDAYNEYLQEQRELNGKNIADGYYKIASVVQNGKSINAFDIGSDGMQISLGDAFQPVQITSHKGYSKIYFRDNNKYLDAYNTADETHQYVDARDFSDSSGQSWVVRESENGNYYITRNEKYALTYDETTGEIYVTLWNRSASQQWQLIKTN